MSYTVYKHTSPSGKVYIGITSKKPEYRWQDGKGYIGNEHFFRAIQKYGWDNFLHEIIADGLTKEQACQMEIDLIARYDSTNPKNGYNKSTGGQCGSAGVTYIMTDEHRRHLSESHRGLSYPNRKPLSEETRKKMSESRKGKPSSRKGCKLTPEQCRKNSESHKGQVAWNKGCKLTPEHRLKLSEAKKGRPINESCRIRSIEARKKPIMCLETGIIYESIKNASEQLGICKAHIGEACNGKRKSACGLHWKFVENL